jgi:hypothetical protein
MFFNFYWRRRPPFSYSNESEQAQTVDVIANAPYAELASLDVPARQRIITTIEIIHTRQQQYLNEFPRQLKQLCEHHHDAGERQITWQLTAWLAESDPHYNDEQDNVIANSYDCWRIGKPSSFEQEIQRWQAEKTHNDRVLNSELDCLQYENRLPKWLPVKKLSQPALQLLYPRRQHLAPYHPFGAANLLRIDQVSLEITPSFRFKPVISL